MKTEPLVSALMVNRNNGRFIDEAIQGVVTQTYTRWELIIVDDASTDDSWDRVRNWMKREPRIRALRLPSPINGTVARNAGLARARGDYVATIDSDDIWLPERLSRQLEMMERTENAAVGVCGVNVWLIDEGGRTIGRKEFPEAHEDCVQSFWSRNPFCHSATLVRRSCYERCGRYDESFEVVEDLDLWLRIGGDFELRNLGEYLVKYRVWRGNLTSRKHRLIVRNTLRARMLSVRRSGYRMGARGRMAFVGTWFAQWLPPVLAQSIFQRWVLRQNSRSKEVAAIAGVLDPHTDSRLSL